MSYQGYPNRATWNASLWIGNQENLYRQACSIWSKVDDRSAGEARSLVRYLLGDTQTPDGYLIDDVDAERMAEFFTDLIAD